MSENEDSFDEDELGEFVPAVVARSAEEAETYRVLLHDHDIPAVVATDEGLDELAEDGRMIQRGTMSHGTPVLVPENLLDEAGQVISEREGFRDLDLAAEEADDDDEDESELVELDGMTELDDESGNEDFDLSAEEPFDGGVDFHDDTGDSSGPDDSNDSDDEIPGFGC